MCGIAGILNISNQNFQVSSEDIHSMCSAIKHRGPDGEGVYIDPLFRIGLGHVRLSIVDHANGQQPMYSFNNKIVISFNGEIYGFKELRNKLESKGYIFKTNTDTEVILNLYQEHGLDFIKTLNGEFSFSLWDIPKQRLILARDRFGVKPLYYSVQNGILHFASEIKAIFAIKHIKRELNLRTIYEQLMRADSAKRTLFSNINILAPGNTLIVENGAISIKKYWDLEFPESRSVQSPKFMEYYSETMKMFLTESVRKRLEADVEIGCYLSGGLDSSIIALLMQELSGKKIKTFSIGFREKQYDESIYANEVANFLGTEHHNLMISNEDLSQAFPKSIFHCEHLVQQIDGAGKYLLSQYASQYVKAVMVGEGADEIALGYPWFKTAKLMNYWNKNRANILLSEVFKKETARKGLDLTISTQNNQSEIINKYGYYPLSIDNITEMQKLFYPLFNKEVSQIIQKFDPFDIYFEDLDKNLIQNRNPIDQNRYEFFKKTFHTYLMQYLGGKTEMANSIESRLPFLDYDLVNFAKEIPVNQQLLGLREKNLLKMSFKHKLPPQIISRTKHGYSSPILTPFLKKNAPEYFSYFLSEKQINETGLFNFHSVQNFIKIAKELKPNDQRKTLFERSIIFVLSVQLMNDIFVKNVPTPKCVKDYI